MAIPLPFNVIRYYLRGPYMVSESAQTEEGLEQFRLEMENGLIDLAAQSYDDMGQARPANLVRRQDRTGEHLSDPGEFSLETAARAKRAE